MGAFFGVSLNLLRSGIRCYGKRRQSFELNKGFAAVKAIRWRVEWGIKKEAPDQSIRNHLFFNIIVTSRLSSHIKAALVLLLLLLVRPVASIVTVISFCRIS